MSESGSVLDWYGCATFRLQTAGLRIFLDAYIDRAEGAQGTGLRADDIEEADWIVIGHSHFDHLYGAERIAQNTGARIIGSYESIRVMEQAGVPLEQMICVAGGETIDLGNGVRVSVYPSQHSCVWSHGQMANAGEVCIGDLGVTWQEQKARFEELVKYLATEIPPPSIEHLVTSQQGDRGDGGALIYLFETAEGRILYQDTSGHWSGILDILEPDVAILAAAGRGELDISQRDSVRWSRLVWDDASLTPIYVVHFSSALVWYLLLLWLPTYLRLRFALEASQPAPPQEGTEP